MPTKSNIETVKTSDRKSTRLNSSHTVIYTLSLHDALPISLLRMLSQVHGARNSSARSFAHFHAHQIQYRDRQNVRSEEHTSELQSHRDLHSFPTRRSSDLTAPHAEPGPRSAQ